MELSPSPQALSPHPEAPALPDAYGAGGGHASGFPAHTRLLGGDGFVFLPGLFPLPMVEPGSQEGRESLFSSCCTLSVSVLLSNIKNEKAR